MNLSARKHTSRFSGFTLIELLVVIGILAILLTIVLVAVNPARQFAQANDTKRRSDVTAILNAIGQYEADNKGNLPTGIPVAPDAAASIGDGTGEANICGSIMPTYISALPTNPSSTAKGAPVTTCTSYDTGYNVQQDASPSKRVTVSTTSEVDGSVISVTR